MPNLVPEELRAMDIVEMEGKVALAEWNKEQRFHQAAREHMRHARRLWEAREHLQVRFSMPKFSPEELRAMDIAELEDMVATASRNAISGSTSGMQIALRHANEIWWNLEEPRPRRPIVPIQRQEISFECPICYNTAESGCRHTCGNIFCQNCLSSWIVVAQTCPLCRGVLE